MLMVRSLVVRGSIPALTGKPAAHLGGVGSLEVYPRAYGETSVASFAEWESAGLSPRLRGNRRGSRVRSYLLRSIPALTGKPEPLVTTRRPRRVYPRAYGETPLASASTLVLSGRSPRLRGNLAEWVVNAFGTRSIPALTGKPSAASASSRSVTVYPRAYGETQEPGPNQLRMTGLSPRLRGNRRARSPGSPERGSIPALTGKPGDRSRQRDRPRVYPRAYGETLVRYLLPRGYRGLSPRLRGNPARRATILPIEGSIPALTGKPAPLIDVARSSTVYPRAYGETSLSHCATAPRTGLSPRLRGNPSYKRCS